MTSPTATREAAVEAPQPSYNIQGREVRLPVDVRDATAAVAFYLVSARAAQTLIDASGLRIAQIVPGRTICTIGTMNYKDGDLGRYHEIALTFFVHEKNARPLPLVGTLWSMLRGQLSAYVHQLPVDGEFTCEAGQTIWGLPKRMSQIDISDDGERETAVLTIDGEHVLTQSMRMGGSRQFGERTQISYALRGGALYRAASEMRGEGVGARMGGATLKLGTHLLAEEFRSLGLPKRALFTTYMTKMTLRFHGAEKTRL